MARCVKGDIDRAWEAVKGANRPRIHTFLATSEIHMKYKLKMTPMKSLKDTDMVSYAKVYAMILNSLLRTPQGVIKTS